MNLISIENEMLGLRPLNQKHKNDLEVSLLLPEGHKEKQKF